GTVAYSRDDDVPGAEIQRSGNTFPHNSLRNHAICNSAAAGLVFPNLRRSSHHANVIALPPAAMCAMTVPRNPNAQVAGSPIAMAAKNAAPYAAKTNDGVCSARSGMACAVAPIRSTMAAPIQGIHCAKSEYLFPYKR